MQASPTPQSSQGNPSKFKMPPLTVSDWVNNQIIDGYAKPVSKITINPSSGPIGSTISVTGTNWPANKKVDLYFIVLNTIYSARPVSAITDTNGILPPTSITLGDSSAGSLKTQKNNLIIIASDDVSAYFNGSYKSPYWAAALFTNTNK